MDEFERNKRLWSLVSKIKDDNELMELVATMINKDTPSMKKTFEILTKGSPIAEFLGVDNLSKLENKEE